VRSRYLRTNVRSPAAATAPAPTTVAGGPRPRPLDGPSQDRPPGRRGAAHLQLLALPGFLGLAVLLLGSTWTSPTTRTLGAGLGDPGMFSWFLRWTPFAAGRGISPLFSDYLNHPDGINLMWNTWVPLPGLLLSPLTLTFGPVLTLNVLLTLGYGLSAWSAYLAIRRYVPNHGAAAAGGLVYGFSPAMVGHSHHPNLILAFLLPWLLVLVDEVLVRQRRSPFWLGATLGVAAAAQLLVGEELFAGAVLVGVVLLLVLAAMHPRSVPGRVRYAAMAFAVSVLVFEALVGLPLRAQFGGQARVHADITEEARGASDLLAVVTPNRLSALAPDAAIRFGDRFVGTKEAYLGVPLLLLVVAVALRRRRSPVVRVGFAMLLACLVLSLGARLRVAGHPTPVRLPWTLVEPLPLLRNMVPSRLALFTALFAGLLLAAVIDGLWRDGGRWRRALAVASAVLALAFLAPAAPLQSQPVVATPPFFTTSAVRSLPRDGVALVVPFPRQGRANQAMLWQAEAGMWFKMPGGYFLGPDSSGGVLRGAPATTTSRILDRIGRGGRPPVLTRALRERIGGDFARWGISSVVLGPMPYREVISGFLTDLLGQRPERLAGVELWRGATVATTARRR
jgi:hypothetical protein